MALRRIRLESTSLKPLWVIFKTLFPNQTGKQLKNPFVICSVQFLQKLVIVAHQSHRIFNILKNIFTELDILLSDEGHLLLLQGAKTGSPGHTTPIPVDVNTLLTSIGTHTYVTLHRERHIHTPTEYTYLLKR